MPKRFRQNLLNTLWVQAPSLLLGFLGAVLLNRLLGPEGKGMYSLFDSTARFLLTLFGFNLGAALIYFDNAGLLRRRGLPGRIGRFVMLVLGLSALVAAGLYLWNPGQIFFPAAMEAPAYGSYYVVWVTLAVGEYLFRSLLQSRKRIDQANLVLLLVKGIRVLALGLALLFFAGYAATWLVTLLLGLNVGLIGLSLALCGWLVGRALPEAGRPEPAAPLPARRLLRYAGFLQLGAVLQFLNYKFDHWVILYFLDNTHLGWYSAANDLAQMIWLPSNLALMLLFPYLSDASLAEADKRRLFLVAIRLVSTLTMGGIAAIWLVGAWLVTTLYGDPFAASALPLKVLILGMGLLNLARTHTVWLTATDSTRYIFYATALAFGCTLGFDLLLIPRLGILGAAAATTIALGAMTAYQLVLSRRKFGIPLRQTLLVTAADLKQLRQLLGTVG